MATSPDDTKTTSENSATAPQEGKEGNECISPLVFQQKTAEKLAQLTVEIEQLRTDYACGQRAYWDDHPLLEPNTAKWRFEILQNIEYAKFAKESQKAKLESALQTSSYTPIQTSGPG